MNLSSIWRNALDELAIKTVLAAPRDYKILVLLRVLRFASFGGVAVVAARYLKLIGFQEDIIGLVFTFIMLGDLVTSFAMSVIADKIGRRNILMISSLILTLTAFIFLISENHVILVTAAVLGFMTPSGNEVGPFRSIEQSIVAHLIAPDQRSDCFAFYIFLSQIAAAIGSIGSGFILQILQTTFHFSEKNADKVVYLILVIFASGMTFVSYMLSDEVELSPRIDENADESIRLQDDIDDDDDDDDDDISFDQQKLIEQQTWKQKIINFVKSVAPNVDLDSRLIVIKLSILFIIDTAAKSLVTKTWVSYYLKEKFNLQAGILGSVFFFHDVLVAILTLVGASISRRKGVIFTMIFTHVPSIVFNTLIPLPNSVPPTVFMVLGRGAFQAMDISSKHAFVSSVVKPEQRTAVIAWTNLCRTVGQSIAPSITGYVTGLNMQWISFVLSGALRLLYDIGLFVNFWKIKDSL